MQDKQTNSDFGKKKKINNNKNKNNNTYFIVNVLLHYNTFL